MGVKKEHVCERDDEQDSHTGEWKAVRCSGRWIRAYCERLQQNAPSQAIRVRPPPSPSFPHKPDKSRFQKGEKEQSQITRVKSGEAASSGLLLLRRRGGLEFSIPPDSASSSSSVSFPRKPQREKRVETLGSPAAIRWLLPRLRRRRAARTSGPSALPYAKDSKWIRNHLVALAEAFPSLHPKATLFTHNDGRAAHLLQADGTIPIHHAGEPYPRSPPSSGYPSPTHAPRLSSSSLTCDMVEPNHPLAHRSGLVANVPYLRARVFPSSNLVDLV
ncbi:hypothetical protein EJB05_32847, partial [Eragrostis curvula]